MLAIYTASVFQEYCNLMASYYMALLSRMFRECRMDIRLLSCLLYRLPFDF